MVISTRFGTEALVFVRRVVLADVLAVLAAAGFLVVLAFAGTI